MNANKLANVRRNILKKIRLTSPEIEEIKRAARKPTNSEKQSLEDVRVKMENLID